MVLKTCTSSKLFNKRLIVVKININNKIQLIHAKSVLLKISIVFIPNLTKNELFTLIEQTNSS